MATNKDKIVSEFKLVSTGGKGWYVSSQNDKLKCPKCNSSKAGKVAIIFGNTRYSFHCVKCGYSGNLNKLLYQIGKRDLIDKYKNLSEEVILSKKNLTERKEEEIIDLSELPKSTLPICFQRIYNSEYLNKRGCTSDIYKNWIIGKTDISNKLKGFVIFVITENNIPVGWVARNSESKESIELYNKSHEFKKLRWKNSEADFGKIVFGLDEITEDTKTIILVEGITSKLNTDVTLGLIYEPEIKCVCSFGKKLTSTQLSKIVRKGINVERIILFYDTDAVNSAKGVAFILEDVFDEVLIAYCSYKKEDGTVKDAGDLSQEEYFNILDNLQTPLVYFKNRLPKRELEK